MPQLTKIKRENFCKLVLEAPRWGWSMAECYQRAGYRCRGHAAEVAASRLLSSVEIKQRIAELMAPAARKAKFDAAALDGKLSEVFDGAVGVKQFGPAAKAAELRGKLHGLMIDRVELGGVGDFSKYETVPEIIDAMFAALGDDPQAVLEQLDEFRAQVEARAALKARDVSPEPARPRVDRAETAALALRASPGGRR